MRKHEMHLERVFVEQVFVSRSLARSVAVRATWESLEHFCKSRASGSGEVLEHLYRFELEYKLRKPRPDSVRESSRGFQDHNKSSAISHPHLPSGQ